MSVWACKDCGGLVHVDFWVFSGNRCSKCAGPEVEQAFKKWRDSQFQNYNDLRLEPIAYQKIGPTIFNKRTLDYIGGPPPWYRRLYWWIVDLLDLFETEWHHLWHETHYQQVKENGRVIGVRCNACMKWIWRQM